jgi:hypothetical protein
VINFKQFFEQLHSVNSLTLHTKSRNPRRNIMNTKGNIVGRIDKVVGDRKHSSVEAIAKGKAGQTFLTHDRAFALAKQYGIDLPQDGQEKSINSNSTQKLINRGGNYYITK